MLGRDLEAYLRKMLDKFPVVTLVGTRQCGKSTMLRACLPEYSYVSLEEPDIREFATEDTRGFLQQYSAPCIIDEAQQVPELFSYIQSIVDIDGRMGQYVLSGSHNFLIMESISQSLTGRTAVLKLAPFSMEELKKEGIFPENPYELMLKGFYPAIYSRKIDPSDYFPSYVQTYIERDVRLIRNIPDMNAFMRFVRLVAARSGQVVSQTELSNACGISVPTVKAWLSVLEQSYVIFFLPPYYKNYSKRLVKSPKLYFYDVGLLCYLLGIEDEKQLYTSDFKGAIFETMVVAEYIKTRYFKGREPDCYFWRDTNQNEVDLLTETNGRLSAYEIKLGDTMNRKYLLGLQKFMKLAELSAEDITCIYTGDKDISASYGGFARYDRAFE